MPIPALIGALGSAAGAASAGASAAGYAATAADLSKLAGGLGSIANASRIARGGITSLSSGLTGLASPISGALGVVAQFRDAITSLGSALAPFIEKANPGLFRQWVFAADDLTASIGRALVPAMEYATAFTRAFADVVYAVSGPLQKLSQAILGPLKDALPSIVNAVSPLVSIFSTLTEYAAAVVRPFVVFQGILLKLASIPVVGTMHLLASGLELLIAPLTVAARLLGDLLDAINDFVDRGLKAFRNLLGMKDIAGGSLNAAARPAQLGSVESFQAKALAAAFSSGASDPQAKLASTAEELYQVVKGELLNAIRNAPADTAKALGDVLGQLLQRLTPGTSTVSAASRTVDDVASAGAAAGRLLEDRARRASRLLSNPLSLFGGES